MIIESIRVDYKSKKIRHFNSSGVKEIKTKNKGDEAIPEGLAYVNNYMTEHNFKLINVTTMDAGSVAYIIYDLQPLSENGFAEYFIVEARNDPLIEDNGLAVWLINERRNLPGTSESNIRRVPRLIQEGGHEPDTDRFFWNSNAATYYDFGPESTPRNSAWTDGSPSFIEIYDISIPGDTMTFSVRIPPIHVDFSNNTGTETGSTQFSFKFLTGAINTILQPPRSIRIAGGSYPEALTITTPCTIAHWKGGSAVVGD